MGALIMIEKEAREQGAGEKEQKGGFDHKKNAQDRIQQLANEKRELAERLERLESQFAKQQEDRPDYVDVDMERVNSYIEATQDKIVELGLEGKHLEAKKLDLSITKLINDIEENEAKKAAFLERQGKSKTEATAVNQRLQKLDDAAKFYRENQKIDQPVWDKMGQWFAEQCKSDPTLGREFAERVEKGEIGAIRWAHDYSIKNMGAKELAAINNKNINKQKASAASPAPGGKSISTVDLYKALAEAKESNTTEGWVTYQALKRKAAGR